MIGGGAVTKAEQSRCMCLTVRLRGGVVIMYTAMPEIQHPVQVGASSPAPAPASISGFKYTEEVVQRVTRPASLNSILVNHTWNATTSVSSVRTTLIPLVSLGRIVCTPFAASFLRGRISFRWHQHKR